MRLVRISSGHSFLSFSSFSCLVVIWYWCYSTQTLPFDMPVCHSSPFSSEPERLNRAPHHWTTPVGLPCDSDNLLAIQCSAVILQVRWLFSNEFHLKWCYQGHHSALKIGIDLLHFLLLVSTSRFLLGRQRTHFHSIKLIKYKIKCFILINSRQRSTHKDDGMEFSCRWKEIGLHLHLYTLRNK
jgi:hypothetical protein